VFRLVTFHSWGRPGWPIYFFDLLRRRDLRDKSPIESVMQNNMTEWYFIIVRYGVGCCCFPVVSLYFINLIGPIWLELIAVPLGCFFNIFILEKYTELLKIKICSLEYYWLYSLLKPLISWHCSCFDVLFLILFLYFCFFHKALVWPGLVPAFFLLRFPSIPCFCLIRHLIFISLTC